MEKFFFKKVSALLLVLVVAALLLCSCATAKMKKNVDKQNEAKAMLIAGDIGKAKQEIAASKEAYKDELVYLADMGWLCYYNGDYKEAIKNLLQAEKLAEEKRVKSFSDGLEKAVASDSAADYVLENYEDVYINLCLALCYYEIGEKDEAFVEIRKVNTKLDNMALNEKEQLSKFKKMVFAISPDAMGAYEEIKQGKEREYTASSLASFLSMRFNSASGDSDTAGYTDAKNLYDNFGIQAEEDDIETPKNKARVNLVSLEGLIANKEEKSTVASTSIVLANIEKLLNIAGVSPEAIASKVGFTGGPFGHKVAWPVLNNGMDSSVVSTRIICSNGQSAKAEIIENMNDTASSALVFKAPSNYLRSYYRGYMKNVAGIAAAVAAEYGAYVAADKISNSFAKKAALASAGVAFQAALSKLQNTEAADLRMASFMPAKISAAGLTLDPGVYDFTVEYTLTSGKKVTREFNKVNVKADELNLIISNCTK